MKRQLTKKARTRSLRNAATARKVMKMHLLKAATAGKPRMAIRLARQLKQK